MKKYRVMVNEQEYVVSIEPLEGEGGSAPARRPQPQTSVSASAPQPKPIPSGDASGTKLEAPLRGTILKVLVNEGATVKAGDVLFTLEALKLENEITAPDNGTVTGIFVKAGDSVETGDVLATIRVHA